MDLLSALPSLLPQACKWAEHHSAHIERFGERLAPRGLEMARRVGVLDPERVRISFVPEIPRPDDPALSEACEAAGMLGPETLGLTLYYGIYMNTGCRHEERMLVHELRHVAQYEMFGSIPEYLAVYLPQIVRHGYLASPFEQDAAAAESVMLD